MKKILILAVTVAATVACTKNSIIHEEPDTPIRMNPAAQISTKTQTGPVNGTAYPQAESFGVFAFYDKNITAGSSWGNDFSTTYINGVEFRYKTDAWTSDSPYYWPKQGSLVFAGYSPFKAAAKGNAAIPGGWDGTGKCIRFTDYVNPKYADGTQNTQNDLMWFDAATTSAQNNSPYPAAFKHALAQLAFNVKAADALAESQLTIKKIELLNVKSQGSFASKPTPIWTNGSAAETYIIHDSRTGAGKAGTTITTTGTSYPASGVLVIPQDQTAVKVYYTMKYNNGKDGDQYLDFDFTSTPASTWAAGTRYTYNITLTATGQITIKATIDDWVNGGNIDFGNN